MTDNKVKRAYEIFGDGAGIEGNFCGVPAQLASFDKSRFCVIPVPFEGTVSFGQGASRAPQAIIEATRNIELMDYETGRHPFAEGIYTAEPVHRDSSLKTALALMEAASRAWRNDMFVVVLGGEHSVTLGSLMALNESGRPFSVVQLDAHSDLRDEYEGNRYSHACVMRRALELENLQKLVQLGVRSSSWFERKMEPDKRLVTVTGRQVHHGQGLEAIEQLIGDVYITLDVDAFDPSVIPATGTPEPDGLSWAQVTRLVRETFSRCKVVGFDLVELAPMEGSVNSEACAAVLAYRMMAWSLG
ncbi:MAG: agmatinase [Planctomycetota bacterium]|nr:agmatinase [Planctomycetota bacterium]